MRETQFERICKRVDQLEQENRDLRSDRGTGYDPQSLLGEAEDYLEKAVEEFQSGLETGTEYHPYGSTDAKEVIVRCPETVDLEVLDDIILTTLHIEEVEYEISEIVYNPTKTARYTRR